jgi:hypothetical protein
MGVVAATFGPLNAQGGRFFQVTEAARFGQRAGEGAASFRCAACGEVAAVVKAVPADVPVDMGPPLAPHFTCSTIDLLRT